MESKIRLRTASELHQQFCGLLRLSDVMQSLNIPFFIGGGTLLGIVRESAFIPWDWDVELDVCVEQVYHRRHELASAVTQAGFAVVRFDAAFINFKLKLDGYGTVFEILGWQRIGAFRYRKAYRLPASLFEHQTLLEFKGKSFPTFGDPIAGLTYMYGDWQTPIRSVDKSTYEAPDCAHPPTKFVRCLGWLKGWTWRTVIGVRSRVVLKPRFDA